MPSEDVCPPIPLQVISCPWSLAAETSELRELRVFKPASLRASLIQSKICCSSKVDGEVYGQYFGRGVLLGSGVLLGIGVLLGVGVSLGVGVMLGVNVAVGGIGVFVKVAGVRLGVFVGPGVLVFVGVRVGMVGFGVLVFSGVP